MTTRRTYPVLGSVVLVALLVAPWFGSHYLHFLLATVMVYTLIGLSLNVLLGLGGQISIGHAGFWALGAYGAALLVTKLEMPFLLSVLLAGGLAAVFGALLALPALRVQGHYLAIATLGFALFIQQALFEWESLTGGRQGLSVPRPQVAGFQFANDQEYYYLLLLVVAVCAWLAGNLRSSHTGHALRALKMSPTAAQCAGIGRGRHLLVAFTTSAFLTGLSGALYAPLIGHLTTETFTLAASLSFLTMAVIGGLSSRGGALLGAIYLTLAPELFRELKDAQMVVYGLTLIACMHFLPGGLVSIPSRLRALWAWSRATLVPRERT